MPLLEKTLRWIVLLGVFALPFIVFIVANTLFFPYITGKNFAFRIIVEVIFGAWLALALANPDYRPKRSWLLLAFAVFVVLIAIADAQGVYPFKSFWSNFERMDGWITQIHLFAYFVVAVSVLNTKKLWRTLWQVSLGVSGLVALNGFLQLIGYSALGQGGAAGLGARLDATFGNPIYLAAYMLFHIFIGTMLWMQAWKEKGPGRRLPVSLLYGSVVVLDTLVLLFTGTRGTMLGLIGGALLALFLYALTSGASRRAWSLTGGTIAVVLVLGALLYAGRDTALVQQVGFLNRLSTISPTESVIKSRFLNASMAWQGVKERPIFGWGQENYAIVFGKYYDPQMYAQEQWFDRVHNTVLDWLVAGGILGLLGYLSLFAAALWALWKSAGFSAAERNILTGLLAAYFFHNLFVFDNITSYVLFVSVLAYIAARAGLSERPAPVVPASSIPRLPLAAGSVCAVVLVWAVAWYVNAAPLQANRMLLFALAPQQAGLEKNLEYFKLSIQYGTYGTQEAREQLAQGAAQLARSSNVTNDVKQRFFDTAAQEMSLQAQASPLDARFPLFLGVLLNAYGDYVDATPALARAHELSSAKQSILYELASNQFALGKTADAVNTFKQAFELATENNDARIYYAAALIRTGDDATAEALLAPILASGDAADPRIAAAYVSRGRYDKIVPIWEARMKARPRDTQAYFMLAAANFGAGNSARAIEVLQAVAVIDPTAKAQADELINEIRNGTAKMQ